MTLRLLPSIGLVLATPALAVSPDDFAYGARLGVAAGANAYVLDLPAEVYAGITRPDLSDLRVFDSQGHTVPFELRLPGADAKVPEPVPVTFYALSGAVPTSKLAQYVGLDPAGSIIGVNAPARAPEGHGAAAYMFDLSQITEPMDVLELEWTDSSGAAFFERVSLEGSNDLVRWSTEVVDAALADLPQGPHRLDRRHIHLPRQPGKYVRLPWPAGARGVRLTGARLHLLGETAPSSMEQSTLPGVAMAGRPGSFEFDAHGYRPVRCAEVALPATGIVLHGVLSSSVGPEGPWQVRYQGLLYELRLEGANLRSDPMCLPSVPDRYWRLDVDPAPALGGGRPRLELAWAPHRLVFAAAGKPPYTLAWGSARVTPEPPQALLAQLAQHAEILVVRPAAMADTFLLGGEEMLRPAPRWPWAVIVSLLVLSLLAAAAAWYWRERLLRLWRNRSAQVGKTK